MRLRRLLSVLFLAAGLASASGQAYQQTWGPVTATGQLGAYRDSRPYGSVPWKHWVDWYYNGTAPTACTFRFEGSPDAIHWFDLTGTQSCTSSTGLTRDNAPLTYFRIYILSYTPGDGTTQVFFDYVRGAQ